MRDRVVTRRVAGVTLPGGPVERKIEYHAQFVRCQWEQDYRPSWVEFERRFKR